VIDAQANKVVSKKKIVVSEHIPKPHDRWLALKETGISNNVPGLDLRGSSADL